VVKIVIGCTYGFVSLPRLVCFQTTFDDVSVEVYCENPEL